MYLAWRASDAQGQIQQGRSEATDSQALAAKLHRQGLTLLEAQTAPKPQAPSRRELIHTSFHLAQLTRAGVPLLDALHDLRASASSTTQGASITAQIHALENGQSFSAALAQQGYQAVIVSLVHAGEASGQLPEMLEQVCEELKWQDELAAQLRQAFSYPLFAASVVAGVLMFLLAYLIPQLAGFLTALGGGLPLSTRILIATSGLLLKLGLPLLLLLLGAGLIMLWQRQYRPALALWLDRQILRLPILGALISELLIARIAGTLARLYAAGIPLLEGLALCRGVTRNQALNLALQEAATAIRNGQGITASFAQTRLFSPLVLRMLRIGEQTGALDRALANVAYFHERDARERINRIQSLIEPVLTVVLGLLLALIMLSVLGPVFNAMGQVR